MVGGNTAWLYELAENKLATIVDAFVRMGCGERRESGVGGCLHERNEEQVRKCSELVTSIVLQDNVADTWV